MDEEESALARALADGDEQAFAILVEQETRRVFRACYRVLGRVDEAEDVTQEAFLLAYRGLGTYRGDGYPAAWLMRIATREAWRRSRQRSRQRSVVSPIDAEEMIENVVLDGPPIDAGIMAEEQRDQVRRAVAMLPDPYREVVTLRYFGELSLKEVSVATGAPLGTVKAQVHRGLLRLRDMVREEDR